jgi:hypothetical protein
MSRHTTDQPTPTFKHTFEASDTSHHATLDSFVEYMDETTPDGIHRIELDRHEVRRMMGQFPSEMAKTGFMAVRLIQLPGTRIKIFTIYAV